MEGEAFEGRGEDKGDEKTDGDGSVGEGEDVVASMLDHRAVSNARPGRGSWWESTDRGEMEQTRAVAARVRGG